MDTSGQLLKAEREKQHKTLDDIADATKISKSVLKLIEEDSYALLPSQSYVRGFLKIYARQLGLEPYMAIDLYEKNLKQTGEKTSEERKPYIKKKNSPLFSIVVVFFVLLIVYLGYRFGFSDGKLKQPQDVSSTTTIDMHADAVVPMSGLSTGRVNNSDTADTFKSFQATTTAMKEKDGPEKKGFSVRFVARELTWIKITIDDGKPFEIMLKAGESFERSPQKLMKVRIGNGGGLSLFYNNIPLGVPGQQGKTLNLQFPDDLEKLQH